MLYRKIIVALLFLAPVFYGKGQVIRISNGAETSPETPRQDTVKKPRSSIKPYASVITKDFTTQKGLFAVHRNRDIVYFEIPDSLLGRDLMVINRLSKVGGGYDVYAGEELDERTIQFERGADSSIRIRYILVINEADSADAIHKGIVRSNVDPIVVTFPILAYGDHSCVIDASRLLKEKSFINNIDPASSLGKNANTGAMRDITIESIHVYPINVEVSVSKTMDSKLALLPANTPLTIETHTSFVELPKVPMQRRYYDPRVGFFTDEVYEYADNQQKSDLRSFVLRWRLEPKPEDIDKWKRGELVEPQKPIVIYIDPAAPKQWRPYLIQGINDWQKAFEQAGFKNAIIGKEWPENDTTMHMDDARYSVLNYFPSEIANAYGPQIHDPRSGEIIQTHIGWYHNVMALLHDWFFIQTAAVDPRARKAKFDDELMGELIRFVSSHEIGHTLGLRHNFGSSSKTPVDSLRSRIYLEAHGHTASIMDYARFDYVAQPEDNIPEEDLFPRIGEYDKWAIEWGYKLNNAKNADEDKKVLHDVTTRRLNENPRLWFGDGELRKFDPRCQTEDLGDNAMKASAYGIKNLQRIMPNLQAWSYEENGEDESLRDLYKGILDQYTRYMAHVLKNVGGVDYTIKSSEERGAVYEPTSRAYHQEAIDFFNNELFKTPTWLLNKDILERVVFSTKDATVFNFVEDIQVKVLNSLLSQEKMNKIMDNMHQFGSKAYGLDEYVTAIHRGIWLELGTATVKTDSYRRNLQKSYVGAMADMLTSKDPNLTENDAVSVVRNDMTQLLAEIRAAIPKTQETITRYHLKDLESRIKTVLDPQKSKL